MYNPEMLLDAEGMPPPPLDCHPAYADKPWVRDWVTGKSPQYNTYHLRIPVVSYPRVEMIEASPHRDTDVRQIIMERHKAMGIAPYVGAPFVYTWWVGIDNLGRHVCSDSEIHYLPPEYQFF